MNTATIPRPTSPQSVLGFSHAALAKLKESRSLLERYAAEQKSKIDSIQAHNETLYREKCDQIQRKVEEFKSIQRQRGLKYSQEKQQQDSKEEEGNIESEDVGIKQKLQKLQEKQMEVERELANLHLEKKQVCKSLLAAQDAEKVAFAKAEKVRKSKERIENAKKITVEDLTMGLVKYRGLGLDFVKSEESGALMFQFTKIDPLDVNRVFEFILKVTEDDLYSVEECNPDLDEKVVMRLVDELNRTNDYPCFMRGMRKAFQQSIQREAE